MPNSDSNKYSLQQLLISHAANALSIGIQIVLVVWLAADGLQATPLQLGLLQSAILLPNIFLLPLAGVFCDRINPLRLLFFSNLALALVHGLMMMVLLLAKESYALLLIYALCLGCGNSFIQVGREKAIARFPKSILHNRISLSGMANQGAQALGILLAGLVDAVSWSSLLALQSGLCLAAGFSYFTMRAQLASEPQDAMPFWASLKAGFDTVWQIIAVRHTVLIVAFNGAMQMGMLLVLLPVIARDKMAFEAHEYSLLQLCFVLGGIVVQGVIWRRKEQTKHPGQGVLFCLLYAGMLALGMAYGPTPNGLFGLVFLWGCVSGASANLARLVLQSAVQASHCGRAMSVYQLALFGFAPLGSLLAGWCLTHISLEQTFRLISYACFGLFAVSLFSRSLWQVSLAEASE